MPLKLALGVTETAAGRRLGALERGVTSPPSNASLLHPHSYKQSLTRPRSVPRYDLKTGTVVPKKIVVIANDISYQSGSFAIEEDKVFHAAAKWAETEGLPLIYLAANSGARIGMAQEVKDVYKVMFKDEDAPEKGYVCQRSRGIGAQSWEGRTMPPSLCQWTTPPLLGNISPPPPRSACPSVCRRLPPAKCEAPKRSACSARP